MTNINDTIIEKSLAFWTYAQKHWRRMIVLGVIVTLLIVATKLFFSYAVVRLEIVDQAKAGSQTRIFFNTNTTSKEVTMGEIHIVSRDNMSVTVQAGNNIRTHSLLDIPWYGIVEKKITLKRDKNADKIAYRSTLDDSCGSYSTERARMLQYDCSETAAVTYFNTPEDGAWELGNVALDFPFRRNTATPYQGGLIGFTGVPLGTDNIPPGYIMRVSADEKVSYYEQPSDISPAMSYTSKIATDQYDQKNNRFIVISPTGALYLGTPTADPSSLSVDYKTILPSKNYASTIEQTTCRLRGTKAICYRGLASNIGDSTQETDKITPEIIRIDFVTGEHKTIPLKDSSLVFDIAVTASDDIYILSHKKLLHLEQYEGSYITKVITQNADAIAANDSLYFTQENGVFQLDKKTLDAHQIFYSHNIKPQKLVAAHQDIIILGKSANTDMYNYAWKLNDEDDLNYGTRLIDLLPSFPESAAYGAVELVGDMAYIQLSSSRDATAKSIAQQKKATLEYLELMGIDTKQLKIANP